MRYWLSGHQWVISEFLVTLQLTVDYVLGQLMCETARFDATVVVESMVVDETYLDDILIYLENKDEYIKYI